MSFTLIIVALLLVLRAPTEPGPLPCMKYKPRSVDSAIQAGTYSFPSLRTQLEAPNRARVGCQAPLEGLHLLSAPARKLGDQIPPAGSQSAGQPGAWSSWSSTQTNLKQTMLITLSTRCLSPGWALSDSFEGRRE